MADAPLPPPPPPPPVPAPDDQTTGPVPQPLGAEAQHHLLQPLPAGKAPVVDATGKVVLINAQDIKRAREEGMRLASPEEVRAQQAQDLYGDPSTQLATGALNAFDAIALGFGKGLIVKGAEAMGGKEAADRMRLGIEASDEANPWARRIGTGLGIVAPMFMGDIAPAGLIGKGATSLAEAIVPGTGAVASGARMALAGGAEMAVWEGGNAFSEAELGDVPLTAEKLFSSAGKGFLIGAGLGGGLSLGGRVIGKMTGAVDDASLRGIAERLADEGTSMDAGYIRKLEAIGIDATKRGSFVLDEPEMREVISSFKNRPVEQHAAAEKVLKRIGQEVGDSVDQIEAIAKNTGVVPDTRSMLRETMEKVVKPLDRIPGLEGPVRKLQEYLTNYGLKSGVMRRLEDGSIAETGSMGNLTFKDVHEFRQVLDDIIFDEVGQVRGASQASKGITRDLRNIQETIFRKQVSAFAPELAEKYISAAERYHVAAKMEKGLAKSAARQEAKSSVGLLDTLAAVGGVATLGPGGALAAFASKAIRQRGPQYMAHVLDRAGRLAVLKQAAAEVDQQIERSAKSLAGPGGSTKPATVSLDNVRRAKKAAANLTQMVGQPEAIRAAAGQHIEHEVAPNVRARYLDLAVRTAFYLMGHKPRGAERNPALPGAQQGEAHNSEWERWGYRFDTAVDPIGEVTRAIKKGRLTKEHVETLNDLYPGLAKQFKATLLHEIGLKQAQGKGPKYTRLVQMSIVLGVPLDATMKAEFITTQQEVVMNPTGKMTDLYQQGGAMGTSAGATRRSPRSSGAGRKRARMTGGEGNLDVGLTRPE